MSKKKTTKKTRTTKPAEATGDDYEAILNPKRSYYIRYDWGDANHRFVGHGRVYEHELGTGLYKNYTILST